jgi:diguanylate cyclase (GGDEF)-like protein
MILLLSTLLVVIVETALATYVVTRAGHHRPARLFLLVAAALGMTNLGGWVRLQAADAATGYIGMAVLVLGICALSGTLLLLFSGLFVPQWWEGRRPIRWIGLPYITAFLALAIDLSGHFGIFIAGATVADHYYVPVAAPGGGPLLVGFFILGWMVHLGILGVAFVRRPGARVVICLLSMAILLELLIGWTTARMIWARGISDLAQTCLILAPLAYAVLQARLFEPTQAAVNLALRAMSEAVAVLDRAGAVVYANPQAARLGLRSDEPFGPALRQAGAPPAEVDALEEQFAHPTVTATPVTLAVGTPARLIQLTLTGVTSPEGRALGTLLLGRDITELERRNTLLEQERTQLADAVHQLAYLASHDPLTALPNRRSLSEALERVVAHARRGTESALLFLDLDNFKVVNDTLGHAAGDRLLVTLAHMLGESLREGDLLARLGGDEFAILLERTSLAQAQCVAERTRARIETFRFEAGEQRFELGISIGVVAIDGGQSAQVVLAQADIAMYAAKDQGRNRVVVYQPPAAPTGRARAQVVAHGEHTRITDR